MVLIGLSSSLASADWLNDRYGKASCVVIDGRNGVDVLVERIKDTWRAKNSVIRPAAKDVIAAVSGFTNGISEGTLTWYKPQTVLNESAITAVKRPIAGGFGFGSAQIVGVAVELPVEVGDLKDIAVEEGQMGHAQSGKALGDVAAEAAQTDDGDGSGFQRRVVFR